MYECMYVCMQAKTTDPDGIKSYVASIFKDKKFKDLCAALTLDCQYDSVVFI